MLLHLPMQFQIQLTRQICSLPLTCLPDKRRWKLRLWHWGTTVHQTHNRISVDIIVILGYNRGSPNLKNKINNNSKKEISQFAIKVFLCKVSFR